MEKSWGYCKNKTENQRQEAQVQTLRTPENSWLQGTLINMSSSKSLHNNTETKHHPRANKFQSKTYHANSPAMQEHIPELQYIGCQNSHQTHRHLKTLLDTALHTRGKKSSSTDQNTYTSFPNQETLTSHPSNPTHSEEPPQWRRTTNWQNTEWPPKTQQSKQEEKAEKYSAGKGKG